MLLLEKVRYQYQPLCLYWLHALFQPETEGFIAIIKAKGNDPDEELKNLVSEEEYEAKRKLVEDVKMDTEPTSTTSTASAEQ